MIGGVAGALSVAQSIFYWGRLVRRVRRTGEHLIDIIRRDNMPTAVASAVLLCVGVPLLVVSLILLFGDDGSSSGSPATPMSTSTATSSPVPPTATATPTPVPSVAILEPVDGASVPGLANVAGTVFGVLAGQVPDMPAPRLYVIVRPRPDDSSQSWWVSDYAVVGEDNKWNALATVGQLGDGATPFTVCAIITNEALAVGIYGGVPPSAIARDCITVNRE